MESLVTMYQQGQKKPPNCGLHAPEHLLRQLNLEQLLKIILSLQKENLYLKEQLAKQQLPKNVVKVLQDSLRIFITINE
jgi:hypothetical protein